MASTGAAAADIDPKEPWPPLTKNQHHDVYSAIDPKQSALDCSGKVVLVTGGGGGIGKGIALSFAKAHAKGIVLLGRTRSTLEECASEIESESEGRTKTFVATADITKQDQVEKAFEDAAKQFDNRIDVLVSNAGGIKAGGSVAEIDIAGFWGTYELNVLGPMIVTQAFCKLAKTASDGEARAVINISSGAAHVPFGPNIVAYGTSKMAITKVIEFLHYENPSWRVFNMQPGVVATELSRNSGRNAPDSPMLPGALSVWLATHPDAMELNGKFLWSNWDVDELLAMAKAAKKPDFLTIALKGWAEDTSAERLGAIGKALLGDRVKR